MPRLKSSGVVEHAVRYAGGKSQSRHRASGVLGSTAGYSGIVHTSVLVEYTISLMSWTFNVNIQLQFPEIEANLGKEIALQPNALTALSFGNFPEHSERAFSLKV